VPFSLMQGISGVITMTLQDRDHNSNLINFIKILLLGTGTGFRFDLKFVLARIDIGMKLRDPVLHDPQFTEGSHWIFLNGPYRWRDFTIVLGIGYPF